MKTRQKSGFEFLGREANREAYVGWMFLMYPPGTNS